MNTVQIVGRIASEIRHQQFATGKSKASFLLAIRRRPPRGSTEEVPPDWIPVETWGAQADNLVRNNGKGSRIGIKGRLQGRFWNPDGGTRGGKMQLVVVADEITFLSPRKGTPSPAPEDAGAPTQGRRR